MGGGPASLLDLSVREFLDGLCGPKPTPGGGSVAALAAALAAGLGEMAIEFTLGRTKFASVQEPVSKLARHLKQAQQLLRGLIVEDAEAYENLLAAFRVDRADPGRMDRIGAAAIIAAGVPLQTAVLARRVQLDLKALATLANPSLRSDVEAGLHLARAAISAAVANTRVNLPFVPAADAERIEEELAALVGGAK